MEVPVSLDFYCNTMIFNFGWFFVAGTEIAVLRLLTKTGGAGILFFHQVADEETWELSLKRHGVFSPVQR